MRASGPVAHARRDTRTAVPLLPAIPNIPSARGKPTTPSQTSQPKPEEQTRPSEPANATQEEQGAESPAAVSSPTKAISAPKSWADLVRSKANAAAAGALPNGSVTTNGGGAARAGSLVEALNQYDVGNDQKVPFLEPRGLINTGNMCYMNSVSNSVT